MGLIHEVTGPASYTVVGTPTIVDGIASGFSNVSGSYAGLSVSNYDSSKAFHWHVKFQYQSPANCIIFGRPTGLQSLVIAYNGLRCVFDTNNRIQLSNTWTANQWYEADLIYDGANEYVLSLYSNGTLIDSKSLSYSGATTFTSICIGSPFESGSGDSFNGSIDLNKTYIKVNGQAWFGVCPIEVKHINLNSVSVNYLVKDGKLVFADSGLYLSGSNTYMVEGSPTIVDNVASGFSSSDYLQVVSNVANSAITEMVWKCKLYSSALGGNTNFVFYKTGGNLQISIYGGTSVFNTPSLWVPGPNTSYAFIDFVPEADTWFWLKMTYDGSTLKLYSSLDGINYMLRRTQENITMTGENGTYNIGYSYGTTSNFRGEIDLNETYIKVNGSLWFYGKNYASQNIAPVPSGYTYGTTTTTAIGWVDMRTQAFTPAPSGATIGRDE